MDIPTELCECACNDAYGRRCFELEPQCYWCDGCRALSERLEREEQEQLAVVGSDEFIRLDGRQAPEQDLLALLRDSIEQITERKRKEAG